MSKNILRESLKYRELAQRMRARRKMEAARSLALAICLRRAIVASGIQVVMRENYSAMMRLVRTSVSQPSIPQPISNAVLACIVAWLFVKSPLLLHRHIVLNAQASESSPFRSLVWSLLWECSRRARSEYIRPSNYCVRFFSPSSCQVRALYQ